MQACGCLELKALAVWRAQGAPWLGWRRLAATAARFIAWFGANI